MANRNWRHYEPLHRDVIGWRRLETPLLRRGCPPAHGRFISDKSCIAHVTRLRRRAGETARSLLPLASVTYAAACTARRVNAERYGINTYVIASSGKSRPLAVAFPSARRRTFLHDESRFSPIPNATPRNLLYRFNADCHRSVFLSLR